MGYLGIKFAGESDNASALFGNIAEKIAKELKNEYNHNDVENCMNTNAAVNCGFFFRDVLVPAMKHTMNRGGFVDTLFGDDELVELAKKTKEKLELEIQMASKENEDDWDDVENRLEHHRAFKSMHSAVTFYIHQVEHYDYDKMILDFQSA